MASEIDICRLALSHVGDPGLITSIVPPDGSAQAARCAVYYPLARTTLMESHTWSFNTKRATLADLNDPTGPWLYRYSYPSDALRVVKVLSTTSQSHEPSEPFVVETDSVGSKTILTSVEEATVVYVFDQVDTTAYSPLVINTLSFLLASYLAGALVKGKAGVALSDGLLKRYSQYHTLATSSDASQHKMDRTDVVPRSIEARQ